MDQETLVKNELENVIREEFECRGTCLVSNGTHAIEVLLTALNLPRGARVLVPELTFLATATAVARCGLIPVYADVSAEHLGITLSSVVQATSDGVDAVIVVHMAGFVNRELDEIASYCRGRDIPLIEDCAQAHHAFYKGVRVGNLGTAATLSFQSSKLLNSGEGGAILSSDENLITRCKAISNWGWPGEGFAASHELPSSNYRLSYLQCERLISEFCLIKAKVDALESFYRLMVEAASRLGKDYLPANLSGTVVDSPFFFVVTNCRPNHQLEPRGQYPLSGSSIVPAILKKWFPDLYPAYQDLNSQSAQADSVSKYVVENFAFLRIGQFTDIGELETELRQM